MQAAGALLLLNVVSGQDTYFDQRRSSECAGPGQCMQFYFSLSLVSRIRFRSVKTTADVLGFVLISLAAVYLAYKNATYKGPRWEWRESCECDDLFQRV